MSGDPRAKRTEVLNLLVANHLEWRSYPQEFGDRDYGYVFEQGGTIAVSGFCSLPVDDLDAACDLYHRSLRWWGDYIQAIVYRLHFGELPKSHGLDFGNTGEDLRL